MIIDDNAMEDVTSIIMADDGKGKFTSENFDYF